MCHLTIYLIPPFIQPLCVCERARLFVLAACLNMLTSFLAAAGGACSLNCGRTRPPGQASVSQCSPIRPSIRSFVRSFVCLFVRPLLGTRFDSDVGAQRLDTGAFRELRERRSQVASLLHSQTNCGARAAIGCWGGQLLAERLSVLRAEPSRAETGWLPADYYMWHLHAPTRVDLAAAARELNHSRRDLSRRPTTMGARLHTLQYHRFGAAKEVARLFVSSR